MKPLLAVVTAVAAVALVRELTHDDPVLTHKDAPVLIQKADAAPALTPAPPSAPVAHASLQQQAECKAIADKYADKWWNDTGGGWGTKNPDTYTVTSHMNMKLGVCLAFVHQKGDYNGDTPEPHHEHVLMDAIAGRAWADFDTANKWPTPTVCWTASYDGSTHYCTSEDEFFKGTALLMND